MKQLRMIIRELREKCLDGEVSSYAWLSTKEMMADCMTMEIKVLSLMEVVIKGKGLILNTPFVNEIRNIDSELRMDNIHNPKEMAMKDEIKLDKECGRQELKRTRSVEDRSQGGATEILED